MSWLISLKRFHRPKPQPKDEFIQPEIVPRSEVRYTLRDELYQDTFSSAIFRQCMRAKEAAVGTEPVLVVDLNVWEAIVSDRQLRLDLRWRTPLAFLYPSERGELYGVHILVPTDQESYSLVDGWMRDAAEKIDEARASISEFTGEEYDPGWAVWTGLDGTSRRYPRSRS